MRARVKVYVMDNQSEWVDKGTGLADCKFLEASQAYHLVVQSEEDPSVAIVNSPMQREKLYQRQSETLIIWSDAPNNEVALSFQTTQGCIEVWDQILEVQKKLQDGLEGLSNSDPGAALVCVTLPEPSIGNLKEVDDEISAASRSITSREKLEVFILETNYLEKLISVFDECEDLESIKDLQILYSIMKQIILLNENMIIEQIISDKYFFKVVGMLEYDPGIPNAKGSFRDYLNAVATFKQIIPIEDEKIRTKVHHTFRLLYIKDTVGIRWVEPGTLRVIDSLTHFFHVDIIGYLIQRQQNHIMSDFIATFQDPKIDTNRRRDMLVFLREFLVTGKGVFAQGPVGFVRLMGRWGLFSIFAVNFQHEDRKVRQYTSEILTAAMSQDPIVARTFCNIQHQEGQQPLSAILVKSFLSENDLGLRAQLAENIRVLLETNSNNLLADKYMAIGGNFAQAKRDPETEGFLCIFYDLVLPKLVEPLVRLTDEDLVAKDPERPERKVLVLDDNQQSLCYDICELLSNMVRSHHDQMRRFVCSTDISKHVALLLRCEATHMRLVALRFFRYLLGKREELYYSLLVHNDLIRPIFETLESTEGKDNLLNSACLEFFDSIRRDAIEPLVAHTVQQFKARFENIGYVDLFQRLLDVYSQMEHGDETESTDNGIEWSSLEQQEAYFDRGDEDESQLSQVNSLPSGNMDEDVSRPALSVVEMNGENELVPTPGLVRTPFPIPPRRRLVDYDDDEDDDDVLSRLSAHSGSTKRPASAMSTGVQSTFRDRNENGPGHGSSGPVHRVSANGVSSRPRSLSHSTGSPTPNGRPKRIAIKRLQPTSGTSEGSAPPLNETVADDICVAETEERAPDLGGEVVNPPSPMSTWTPPRKKRRVSDGMYDEDHDACGIPPVDLNILREREEGIARKEADARGGVTLGLSHDGRIATLTVRDPSRPLGPPKEQDDENQGLRHTEKESDATGVELCGEPMTASRKMGESRGENGESTDNGAALYCEPTNSSSAERELELGGGRILPQNGGEICSRKADLAYGIDTTGSESRGGHGAIGQGPAILATSPKDMSDDAAGVAKSVPDSYVDSDSNGHSSVCSPVERLESSPMS